MFAGLWRSISFQERTQGGFIYNTELLTEAAEFIGRLIIHYNKPFRHSYPHALTSLDGISIKEILREPYTMTPFPGYEHVNLILHSYNPSYCNKNLHGCPHYLM